MINADAKWKKKGVLVIAHGSRNNEANEAVTALVERLKGRLETGLVEAAFLELANPSIPEGIRALAAKGMETLVVYPFFLSMGVHLKKDVPQIVEEAVASLGRELSCQILEPLGMHPKVMDIIVDTLLNEVRE
ncbi:MAG: CbiX/SirB N-terminal domain-containing protein [bacterium]|nr:CbiX/SirB N-terminal domain-containing protein [bacterium]